MAGLRRDWWRTCALRSPAGALANGATREDVRCDGLQPDFTAANKTMTTTWILACERRTTHASANARSPFIISPSAWRRPRCPGLRTGCAGTLTYTFTHERKSCD
jgi:hypothetical protein